MQIKLKNDVLSVPCREVKEDELEHALLLGQAMIEFMEKNNNAIGLAANQLGHNVRVCVTKTKGYVIWVNPKIVSGEGEVLSKENCLSFPGKVALVKRFRHFRINSKYYTGNRWHDGDVYFYAPNVGESPIRGDDFYECTCIQHEIDHLDGITMIDKRIDTTITQDTKIGRNEKVTIKRGNETKTMKYKKAESLIKEGDWKLC